EVKYELRFGTDNIQTTEE
ncbi:unnamed protein product, partial [Allacma fusca]